MQSSSKTGSPAPKPSPDGFSHLAAQWDMRTLSKVMSEHAANAIKARIPAKNLSNDMVAMDLGCGTGLLSAHFFPSSSFFLGVDPAPGMIEVFNKKVADTGLSKKVHGIVCEIKNGGSDIAQVDASLPTKFDLIMSHMAFHHIDDIKHTVSVLAGMLKPGGYLAISDLEFIENLTPRFHPKDRWSTCFHVEGFKPADLKAIFSEAGLIDAECARFMELEKGTPVDESVPAEKQVLEVLRFPLLLATGRKVAGKTAL